MSDSIVHGFPHFSSLVRADAAGLPASSPVDRTGVVDAVASAVRRSHEREHRRQRRGRHVHAIADRSVVFRPSQDPATARAAISTTSSSGRRPLGKPALSPARKPSRFAMAKGVGGMPVFSRIKSAIGPASCGPQPGQMGALYCTSGKQVGTRRRRHRNADGPENLRQQRIQKEVRELAVVRGIVHAEAILGARADDQLVDQRIALALNLRPAASLRRTVVIAQHRDTCWREVVP